MTQQDLNDRVTRLEERYTNIDQRLGRVETQLAEFRTEVNGRLVHFESQTNDRLTSIETELLALNRHIMIVGMSMIGVIIGGFAAVTTAIIILAGRIS